MSQYIFILGNNPELSIAEIESVFNSCKIREKNREYLVLEGSIGGAQEALNRLGGTIKIGEVIGTNPDQELAKSRILASRGPSKANFGFSHYGTKPDKGFGLSLKKELKAEGISSRLVVSRDKALSSVIVSKEKCLDFLVLPGYFGVTLAVQDFKDYSTRDYGRPRSDVYSGMLPPKTAKMMLNLSGLSPEKDEDAVILDPFCGSGTVLMEAYNLGFKHLIGSDISSRAIEDTKENLIWIVGEVDGLTEIPKSVNIFNCDVRKISNSLKAASVDAIVTEPYLGPPMRGTEKEFEVKRIMGEIKPLYIDALKQFYAILKKGGRAVIVIPEWHLGQEFFQLYLNKEIKNIGFNDLSDGKLYYRREGQSVWRNILVLEKE